MRYFFPFVLSTVSPTSPLNLGPLLVTSDMTSPATKYPYFVNECSGRIAIILFTSFISRPRALPLKVKTVVSLFSVALYLVFTSLDGTRLALFFLRYNALMLPDINYHANYHAFYRWLSVSQKERYPSIYSSHLHELSRSPEIKPLPLHFERSNVKKANEMLSQKRERASKRGLRVIR